MGTVPAAEEISNRIRALDRCWLEGRFADLKAYLAEDVVFVAPNGKRAMGRDTAIAGYQEFMGRAKVRRFETSDPVVTQQGDAAVAEYGWEMAWDSGGQSYDAKGRDILVLAQIAGNWSVIWRTQLSS
jgi:ketosteroid isomerase-like protein